MRNKWMPPIPAVWCICSVVFPLLGVFFCFNRLALTPRPFHVLSFLHGSDYRRWLFTYHPFGRCTKEKVSGCLLFGPRALIAIPTANGKEQEYNNSRLKLPTFRTNFFDYKIERIPLARSQPKFVTSCFILENPNCATMSVHEGSKPRGSRHGISGGYPVWCVFSLKVLNIINAFAVFRSSFDVLVCGNCIV